MTNNNKIMNKNGGGYERNNRGNKKYFVPVTRDKTLWDKDADNMIFINSVYLHQCEKLPNDFFTVYPNYSKYDDNIYDELINKLINVLGKALNTYNGVNENFIFWKKHLYIFLYGYIASVKFTLEQLDALFTDSRLHDKDLYTVLPSNWRDINSQFLKQAGWADDIARSNEYYRIFLYSYLLENRYKNKIKTVKYDKFLTNVINRNYNNKYYNFFMKLKKATPQKILEKLCCLYYARPNKMKCGVYSIQSTNADKKLLFKSKGKIQPIKNYLQDNLQNEIDKNFRNELKKVLKENINENINNINMDNLTNIDVILDTLPDVLPMEFIENFKDTYEAAEKYLAEHKNLKLIYTEGGTVYSNYYKFVMLLLQKRGGKVIAEQHGGDYQVLENHEKFESNICDKFCFWGKGAEEYTEKNCQIMASTPHYKLAMYDKIEQESNYVLFLGTLVEPYVNFRYFGNIDEKKEDYIIRKKEFLSGLNKNIFSNTLIRDYYADSGYDVTGYLKKNFNDAWIDDFTAGSIIRSYSGVDCMERNYSFADRLSKCSIFVVDHISTTWLEALYINKPFICCIPPRYYNWRKEEYRFVKMMQDCGIIQTSPQKAAELINSIYGHEQEWWNEPTRKKVVDIIRERYTTHVDDIDDWFCNKLLYEEAKYSRSTQL